MQRQHDHINIVGMKEVHVPLGEEGWGTAFQIDSHTQSKQEEEHRTMSLTNADPSEGK